MFKGHTLVVDERQADSNCEACHDDWCHVPSKLRSTFEPELMVKMADCFLVGRAELDEWLAGLR